MDAKRVADLVRTLGDDPNPKHTVVLRVHDPEVSAPVSLDPSKFPSRTAYRQALIDARKEQICDAAQTLAARLTGQGVTARAVPLAEAVIIEANLPELRAILEDPDIADAHSDASIDLIRPKTP